MWAQALLKAKAGMNEKTESVIVDGLMAYAQEVFATLDESDVVASRVVETGVYDEVLRHTSNL